MVLNINLFGFVGFVGFVDFVGCVMSCVSFLFEAEFFFWERIVLFYFILLRNTIDQQCKKKDHLCLFGFLGFLGFLCEAEFFS